MSELRPLLMSLVLAAAACAAPPPSSGPPLIGDAGSAARGLVYAQEVCADCHAVAPDMDASPHPDAPAFATIVQAPGMTGTALNVWLHSDHEQMPHLIIDPDRVDDLWTYMSTLRQEQSGNR